MPHHGQGIIDSCETGSVDARAWNTFHRNKIQALLIHLTIEDGSNDPELITQARQRPCGYRGQR